MTIKQLKKILEKFPENTRVMARGYEEGFCDAKTPKEITKMSLNVHPKEEWYYGPHEPSDSYFVTGIYDKKKKGKRGKVYKKVNAIIL